MRRPRREPEVRLRRLLQLVSVLVRHVLAGAFGRLPRNLRRKSAELSEPERLRSLFEELGGTFIKLGQMLALQPDLLPREYCDALFNLLDRVPPFSGAEVERVVTEELGRPPGEVFDAFERRPIASASIGQVHLAHLGGRKVAVKVQRPTAERDFGGDLRLVELAMGLIRRLRLRRLFFLLEPLSEFVEWTADELDYRREAGTMEELCRGSRDRPHQRVPEVLLVTRRVLVMEFFTGVTVLDYLRAVDSGDEVTRRRLAADGFEAERFAAHVIDNFFHQAFVYGLFHADLHPANLMILPGNVVGYLDLGISGTLSPYSRRQLAAMTLGYTRGDVDGISTAFNRVALADEAAAERYRQGLERLAEEWYERADGTLRLRRSFTLVMLDMLRLSRQTGVWAQRDVLRYVRCSIAVDGLMIRLAPGIDVGRQLERACMRHGGWGLPSPAGLLAGASAGVRQVLGSGWRAAALLESLARGELPLSAEVERPRQDEGETRRFNTVALATLILALALVTTRGDASGPFGFNLLTAQVLLLVAALGQLVGGASKGT